MEISHSNIDGKICKTKDAGSGKYGVYGATYSDSSTYTRTLCGAKGNSNQSGTGTSSEYLKHFAEKTLKDGKNWPTSTDAGYSSNDNAKKVATDLVALNRDEKTIVAGLLAKTIEGGEVVEIRAVSSTSVMVNACYDLLSEGLGVVPYACVGLGGNFVGVVDGHITPKLACGFGGQGKARK
ncbi:Major surface antigen 4 precursor [Anaplasma phagocytophilum]|nr:Major surface antigen 4 precursor [Anaplasma phagocytophilum]SCV64733.1 Major surface antigen 4 precursor [Anaplasma phagocytophilum]SCV65965.1 Major surface antigen 4 precursor [Anaplasma phagocytophilum]